MASISATASYDGTAKIVDRSGRLIQVLGETSGPRFGQFNFSDVAFQLRRTPAYLRPGSSTGNDFAS